MNTRSSDIVDEMLASSPSRKHFLTGAAAIAATVGLAPSLASAAGIEALLGTNGKMKDTPAQILNIAATAEAAAVTALYNVHVAVNHGVLNVMGAKVPVGALVSIVRAALREEQDHLAFVMGAGGKPLYTSFSFPNAIFTDAVQTLKFFLVAEEIFVAAYMAACRDFAAGGQAKLAQYAYQIGGVEAEHRTLMRVGLGMYPPNNQSFETNKFGSVSAAAAKLQSLGIFHPNLKYPGAMAVERILATSGDKRADAGVTQRKP
jgi:hypothetical protein